MSGASLKGTLEYVRRTVAELANDAGRHADDVRLIAVSKTRPAKAIRAARRYGQIDFGENYVQEWQDKADELTDVDDIQWHIIGSLQSNKVRYVVGKAAVIHGVDRKKIIDEIAGRAEQPQSIILQVNLSGEPQKAGCDPEMTEILVRHAIESEYAVPIGLMTIPPENPDPEAARPYFRKLRELRDQISEMLEEEYPDFAPKFKELSMGMSHDMKQAIEEGATMVRIGTAIFGARPVRGSYSPPIEDELPQEMRG